MAVGLCARCDKRGACHYRQPGTWVIECGLFDQGMQPVALASPSVRRSPGARPPLAREQTRPQSVY